MTATDAKHRLPAILMAHAVGHPHFMQRSKEVTSWRR